MLARKPYIDADICTGCELCTETLPNVFEMSNDVASVSDTADGTEEEIQDVIDNCPVEAISWLDE